VQGVPAPVPPPGGDQLVAADCHPTLRESGLMHSRGLVPNRGGGLTRRRPRLDRANYVLEGPLRFVDRRAGRAALRIEDGNAVGRRFVGRTVTLDVAAARISTADRNADGAITMDDLVAGERVVVSLRLPRRLEQLPELLAIRRLTACDSSARS
jgi:hypothetical protein